ncbi:MAG: hypothetical protein JKX94_00780, partial [Sneathiella sp.]|nr:hypothetical protein [Sneathiella sp.]
MMNNRFRGSIFLFVTAILVVFFAPHLADANEKIGSIKEDSIRHVTATEASKLISQDPDIR